MVSSVHGEVRPGLAQHHLHYYEKAAALGCLAALLWAAVWRAGVQSCGAARPRDVLCAADPSQSALWVPQAGAVGLPSAALCRGVFPCSMAGRDLQCFTSAETPLAPSCGSCIISCGDFSFSLDSHLCLLYWEAVNTAAILSPHLTTYIYTIYTQYAHSTVASEGSLLPSAFSLAGLFLDHSFPAKCIPRVWP